MFGARWIGAGVTVALLALGAGKAMGQSTVASTADHRHGLLHARPHLVHAPAAVAGTQSLGITPRDGLLYIPTSYRPDRPPALMLLLHGAGARAEDIFKTFRQIADDHGVLLVVPSSRGQSWDVVLGHYGEDVARIDKALTRVLDRYAVDPARIAIAGFSDGASYALSLGILNGALFTHVLAFSPGFTASSNAPLHPRIFVSHGLTDSVLPIDQTSRKIVPRLRQNGFEVVYREFPDGHVVPPELADEAFNWFVKGESKAAILQGQLPD